MRIALLAALCVLWAALAHADETGIGAALNQVRATKGLAAVQPDRALQAAAERHGQDMAASGFFSHSGSDGSGVSERVKTQGYGFCFVAENLAKGSLSASDVIALWQSSKGHRQNMLDRRATEFGAARVGVLWVLVLGRPGC